jgi:hypothetical protein
MKVPIERKKDAVFDPSLGEVVLNLNDAGEGIRT